MTPAPQPPAEPAAQAWDPFNPESLADPYPFYRRLRADGPLIWHDALKAWVTAHHSVCRRVLEDADTFAADFRRLGEDTPAAVISVQSLDPPDHTFFSRMLTDAIKAQDLQRLGQMARATAQDRLAALAGLGGGDLIGGVAVPVAAEIAVTLLGLPEASRETFIRLSATVVASRNAGLRPQTHEPGVRAREELSAAIASCLDGPPPGPGVIAHVAPALPSGDPRRRVLENSLRVLLLAGINSTQRMIGLAAWTLLRHPQTARALRAGAPLSPATRELIRFDSPVQAQSRMAAVDTEVAGVPVRRGDMIVALLGAANHDPAEFGEPDRLVLDRTPNRSLGFGTGNHACLGTPVALTILHAVLTAGWREQMSVHDIGDAEFDQNPTLRGLIRLEARVSATG